MVIETNIAVEIPETADKKNLDHSSDEQVSHNLKSGNSDNSTPVDKDDKNKKKELQRVEGIKKKNEERELKLKAKEEEKALKLKQKEEEKRLKEEEKRRKELERKRKADERGQEKELKRIRLANEKKERDRLKEEQRLKKQAEREEKEKERHEKKLKMEKIKEQKDLEKKKVEEMKQRNQMKISNFFSVKRKSSTAGHGSTSSNNAHTQDENPEAETIYIKTFLPFFQKKNCVIKDKHGSNRQLLKQNIEKIDQFFKGASTEEPDICSFLNISTMEQPSIEDYTSPSDIINSLNSPSSSESIIYQMLQNLGPIKYLQFYENTRPPYIGTWSSEVNKNTIVPITNPFDTSNPIIDYSYDSDIEWNGEDAEGEGEDIDDDDEEEEDEIDEDEEMEDFVEANEQSKLMKYMGPLVAVTRWNDGKDLSNFKDLKYERLHQNISFSIDPFYDYWIDANEHEKLHASSGSSVKYIDPQGNNSSQGKPQAALLKPHKPVIDDPKAVFDLMNFVEKNNDYTIGTLVELSQKEFKDFTKSLIKHTIQKFASYNKKSGIWTVTPEMRKSISESISSK